MGSIKDVSAEARKAEPLFRWRHGISCVGYWEPDYEPKDTDLIAVFRVTPQEASIRSKLLPRSRAGFRPRPGRSSGPTV